MKGISRWKIINLITSSAIVTCLIRLICLFCSSSIDARCFSSSFSKWMFNSEIYTTGFKINKENK